MKYPYIKERLYVIHTFYIIATTHCLKLVIEKQTLLKLHEKYLQYMFRIIMHYLMI